MLRDKSYVASMEIDKKYQKKYIRDYNIKNSQVVKTIILHSDYL